ncbi:MAG: DNA polymerase III subunit gamma/tau [Methylococcales bacterium]|nr:DNA polymerase III subunit gamma/tau [Methylococcales bacterium]
MAYQVLARKWRPHNFTEIVGQAHVVQSLTHALQHERLHHAYLFTGTRGVGKTTIARILAKAINCENLQDFNPCGQCDICVAVDNGCFLDLIEVDAASRTKVEDTRDLLDNAQYAPNRGRYKVYLIDEVHMLSGHSFNALLKTLEEPPAHVKFLLATTDPHKIPVTVLSRCLQFNLKRLSPVQISAQMEFILQQEQIAYELPALTLIARAADGSMRDGLSLLDQAIVFGSGLVNHVDVLAMLGTVAQQPVTDILRALADNDANAVLTLVAEIAHLSPDFTSVVQEILHILHRVALYQVAPISLEQEFDPEAIIALATLLSPEDVQLYYQIALIGQRDLALAPDPQAGFEMILLRMLTFRPVSDQIPATSNAAVPTQSIQRQPLVKAAPSDAVSNNAPLVTKAEATSVVTSKPLNATSGDVVTNDWTTIIHAMKLEGMTRQLANNCILENIDDNSCTLIVDVGHQHLCGGVPESKLQQALQTFRGKPLKLLIKVASAALETPATVIVKVLADKQQAAAESINNDENVLALKEHFDARIMPGTIEPL